MIFKKPLCLIVLVDENLITCSAKFEAARGVLIQFAKSLLVLLMTLLLEADLVSAGKIQSSLFIVYQCVP